jgi:hypothetical protein
MRRTLLVAAATLPLACGPPLAPPPAVPTAPPTSSEPPTPTPSPAAVSPAWPDALSPTMSAHGDPHAQPMSLPPDPQGRDRWLAFVGTSDVAFGAWRVGHAAEGTTTSDPVERWPEAVRVVGGIVEDGVAYVMLETLGALDQPAGLRGVWIDGVSRHSAFEGSPLALADTRSVDELAARVRHPVPLGSPERNAASLVATLRAASTSTGALVRALANDGADVGVVWQATFVQQTAHLDGQGAAPSSVVDRSLAVVRSALDSQACGVDACEAWTDAGHAVVRFVVQGGRWVIRWILEDAPVAQPNGGGPRREVVPNAQADATNAVLHARAREITRVIGEAPLTPAGGTIGVALTDLAPDTPVVAVSEGAAARVFVVDVATARRTWTDAHWDAAFADVDGDGRTDVVLRLESPGGGSPVTWTQVFLAPPPSVQTGALQADVASALVTMDAADVHAAARDAASAPARGIARDEACRLLSAASTPAGFRRVATPDARVLRFDQPGMPTWLPKIVHSAKVATDDVRGLGAHCAELACSASRPYCAWSGGTDSQHFWFGWRDGDLAILGAADYDGE